jgi:hypothetical protein
MSTRSSMPTYVRCYPSRGRIYETRSKSRSTDGLRLNPSGLATLPLLFKAHDSEPGPESEKVATEWPVIQELVASGRQHRSLPGETSHNQTSGAVSIFKLTRQPTGILVA